jgi:threonine/homoserine/homoserine lactone efflux protein
VASQASHACTSCFAELLHALLSFFLSSCCCSAAAFAAVSQGAAKQALLDMRSASAWVTPTSGVLLVAGGTYSLLTRLLPAL